jgi:hypothetical protein
MAAQDSHSDRDRAGDLPSTLAVAAAAAAVTAPSQNSTDAHDSSEEVVVGPDSLVVSLENAGHVPLPVPIVSIAAPSLDHIVPEDFHVFSIAAHDDVVSADSRSTNMISNISLCNASINGHDSANGMARFCNVHSS